MSKKQHSIDTGEESKVIKADVPVVREVAKVADFKSFYVNDTQIQITPWDVRFIFGLISDTPTKDRKTIAIDNLVDIRMSPQHAKRVATILLNQIRNYEQHIGIIPLPEE